MSQAVQALHDLTFPVQRLNTRLEVCFRNLLADSLFYSTFETLDFLNPQALVSLPFDLRDFNLVGRNVLVKQFPCLLFRITGRLSIDKVNRLEKGADTTDLETKSRSNHRTDIAGQDLFCVRNRPLRTTAQTDTFTVGSLNDLFWQINAEGPDDRPTF